MKKYFLYTLLFFAPLLSMAQDVHFSQYFNLPLFTNPAYAGIHQQTKVGLIYRNQGQRMPASYATYGVMADKYFHQLHGGVGLVILKDDQANGILQNQQINLSYAYQNAISKQVAFRFAMEAAYHINMLNTSKIIVYDMLDPRTGQVYQPLQAVENVPPSNKQFVDINAGTVFYNNDFYVALGTLHLNKPDDGYRESHVLPLLINFQSGYIFRNPSKIKSNDDWYFSPNLQYINQQKNHEINITALAGLGYAQAGLGIRNSGNWDAMIFYTGFTTGNFKVGYSFDLNISTKYFVGRNSHEISLQYIFEHHHKEYDENNWAGSETKNHNRRIKCPKFFR